MKSSALISVVLMSSLVSIGLSQGKDFCEAFVGNGDKIDFGYQHYPYDHEFFTFWYVVIGQNYWRLKYDIDKDTIFFESTKSRNFGLQGNQYRAAVIGQECLTNQTVSTALLKKSENKLEWINFDHNKTTGDLKTNGQAVKQHDIDFGADFSPKIGFDAFPNGFIFLQMQPNQGKMKFKKTFRGYGFNKTLDRFIDESVQWIEGLKKWMDGQKVEYGADNTILNNVPEKYNYLAIFNPPLSILYNPFAIILFSDEKSLFYCFMNEKIIPNGCFTGRHPIRSLIDCSNGINT